MPRLKSVTDANGTKIYPITITRGVYDTDKNQRLDVTLANKADNTIMGASGSNHAPGLVPDTPSTAGTTKYLREDGTWQTPPVLALGETSSTAYAGDKGKALADKLATIETGAEANVQSDWNATSGDAFIKNKPTIPDSFQWYGTSSTAAATVQKEVSIPSITSLKAGQLIIVLPTVTSTVADSTLKLNSFDAYPMRYGNAAITTSTDSIVWSANYPSVFVFDGSYWIFLTHGYDSNTTYSTMSVAEGTTGTKTTARSISAVNLKQIIQAWAPQSDWNATSGNAVILNKPAIPTVNNGKFSIKGAGTEVASTTANASSESSVDIVADGNNVTVTPDATNNQIKIAATNTTYKLTIGSTTNGDSTNGVSLGTLESKAAASSGTDLSLVTTGEKNTWNSKQNALTNPVTRSGSTALTANKIVLGNGNNTVIPSSYGITATAPSFTSDDTSIPTSKAVWSAVANGIATNDAMVYKGTIAGGSTGNYGALTVAADKGHTYKVSTAGKVNGVAVEVGDIIICNTDSTAAATSSNYSTIAANWDFILANIDGAVTGPASSTDGNLASFNGATGKVVKDSGLTTTNVSDAVTKKHSHSSLTLSTTAQAYDGTHTLALPSSDPYSSARTPASHTHGNIQNGGTLLTNDVTIANGDKLVVTDSSDSNKVARTSVSFDGSTTTKALTLKGTFESFATSNTTYKFTIGTTTKGDGTNGVDLGTLKSETAAASGTTLSLVTTGEKATWNAKQNALTFTSTPSSTNKVVTLNDVPDTLPASDVSAWAKESSKPSYNYSEIGYTVNTTTANGVYTGAITIDGTKPIHVIAITGDVTVTLSQNPPAGHSTHVLFTSTAARTVTINHDSTSRVCPEAANVTLNVVANGYVEVDFLNANSKIYVRGV